jgi:hypothetical protein
LKSSAPLSFPQLAAFFFRARFVAAEPRLIASSDSGHHQQVELSAFEPTRGRADRE